MFGFCFFRFYPRYCLLFFFFFSSRRRHTRLTCDWSSDVCSSDLFRPRLAKNRWGKHFVNFLPAVSKDAITAMGREIRSWHIARRSDKSLEDLARMFNPIVQGWINYYGRFYKSMLYPLLRRINDHLVRCAIRKYRRLRRREQRAIEFLARV